MTASRILGCGLCLLLAAASAVRADPPPQAADASAFQIVASVPQATVYGTPGVPRTQAVWLQMLGAAKQRIDIATFYFSDKPGAALEPVLDALVARARAGVAVRIVLDHLFMKQSRPVVERLRKVPGINIRVLPVDKLTGGVLHAKYMVIDGARVFVGSQNWDWRSFDQIREIGARIDDARIARSFEAGFDFLWRQAAHPSLAQAARDAVKPLAFAPVTAEAPVILDAASDDPLVVFPAFSPPALKPRWLSNELDALLRMIDASQHILRVHVMTLTAFRQFGPKGWWPPLDTALRDAAARGVEVRIIVADWALDEPTQSYLKSLAVLPGIEVKFSRLPPSPRGFIPYARVEHGKYAIADDRSIFIGTGNWGWSYFNASVDASIFVHGRRPAQTLTRIFEQAWNGPYVTTLQPGRHYDAPRRH